MQYWPRFFRLTTHIILTYLSTNTIYCTVTQKDSLNSQHSQTHFSWVKEASHHNNTHIVTSILKTHNTHRTIVVFSFPLSLVSQSIQYSVTDLRFLRLTTLIILTYLLTIQYSVTQKDSLDSQHSQTYELKKPHLTINTQILTSILRTHSTHRPNSRGMDLWVLWVSRIFVSYEYCTYCDTC